MPSVRSQHQTCKPDIYFSRPVVRVLVFVRRDEDDLDLLPCRLHPVVRLDELWREHLARRAPVCLMWQRKGGRRRQKKNAKNTLASDDNSPRALHCMTDPVHTAGNHTRTHTRRSAYPRHIPQEGRAICWLKATCRLEIGEQVPQAELECGL